MTPRIYYYLFSLIPTALIMLDLVSTLYRRLTGRTILGVKLKPGTPLYKMSEGRASGLNIILSAILVLVFGGGLLDSAQHLIQLNTRDAYMILVLAPIFTILLFGIGILVIRNRAKNYTRDRSSLQRS